ncbi:MAG TPA: hypothetical protein VGB52_15515 [Actinomycetota bacterium]
MHRQKLTAGTAIVVLAAALLGQRALAGGADEDTLTELLIKFQVIGTFESFDPAEGVATFTFAGPFYASQVSSGVVDDAPGPKLGEVTGARVEFRFRPDAGGLRSDNARFSCDECRFEFDDGSVLQPMLDDPSTPVPESDIPMEGRLLFELGPVPGPTPDSMGVRGIGCGGTKETAGAGSLAGLVGALCVNGLFSFSPPVDFAGLDPADLVGVEGYGESDCTLVFNEYVV